MNKKMSDYISVYIDDKCDNVLKEILPTVIPKEVRKQFINIIKHNILPKISDLSFLDNKINRNVKLINFS